jgi:hypothetical protein
LVDVVYCCERLVVGPLKEWCATIVPSIRRPVASPLSPQVKSNEAIAA